MYEKTKISITVCEFIETMLAYIGLYTFICTILPIGENKVFDIFLVIIGYLLCTTCKALLKNVPSISLGYLLIFSAMCVYGYFSKISQAGALVTNMAMAFIFFLFQIKSYQNGFEKEPYHPKWYYYFLPIILYFYGMITGITFTKRYALFCGLVFLIIQFWCKYLTNMYMHLYIHPEMGEEKQQEFFNENTRIILYYLLAFSLILICISFFEFDFIIIWIGQKIVFIISFILYSIAWCIDKIMTLLGLFSDGTGLSGNIPNFYSQYTDGGNPLAQFIIRLFGSLFCMYLVYRLLRSAKHYFFEKKEMEKPHVKIYDPENYEEDQFISLHDKKKKAISKRPVTNQEKIRFLYRKYILSHKKKADISKSQTARELAFDICHKDGRVVDKMQKATSLYEKARYGKEEMTSLDVEEMKSYK